MTLEIPENTGQVLYSFRHDNSDRDWALTHGIDFSTYGDDPDQMTESLASIWSAQMAPIHDSNQQLREVVIRANIGAPEPVTFASPQSIYGGVGNSTPPPNVAVLVKKNCSISSKRNKGRMFLNGFCNASAISELGVIDGGPLAAIQGALDDWNDALTSGGLQMLVLHNDPPVGVDPGIVTSLVADNIVATQRRRLRK